MSSVKSLKIKTGSLKRLVKDKEVYLIEIKEIQQKYAKLAESGADEWDLKKQGEVLKETLDMIPGCDKRIATAYEDLENFVNSNDPSIEGTEELAEAVAVLKTITVERL